MFSVKNWNGKAALRGVLLFWVELICYLPPASVRMGRNCALALENGPRPQRAQAFSTARAQFLPIQTFYPVNNMYFFEHTVPAVLIKQSCRNITTVKGIKTQMRSNSFAVNLRTDRFVSRNWLTISTQLAQFKEKLVSDIIPAHFKHFYCHMCVCLFVVVFIWIIRCRFRMFTWNSVLLDPFQQITRVRMPLAEIETTFGHDFFLLLVHVECSRVFSPVI